eukprot:TRINITY_DN21555_c0_g1_i1.p1 TRINITY_DN21555_c0_g1~~TRINITY_DN21555_c0_g1_i1.p1  ORF type:complete len:516 (+),score=109.32 TRINITY_DN21555_c0_g1_i1:66-1550(+)
MAPWLWPQGPRSCARVAAAAALACGCARAAVETAAAAAAPPALQPPAAPRSWAETRGALTEIRSALPPAGRWQEAPPPPSTIVLKVEGGQAWRSGVYILDGRANGAPVWRDPASARGQFVYRGNGTGRWFAWDETHYNESFAGKKLSDGRRWATKYDGDWGGIVSDGPTWGSWLTPDLVRTWRTWGPGFWSDEQRVSFEVRPPPPPRSPPAGAAAAAVALADDAARHWARAEIATALLRLRHPRDTVMVLLRQGLCGAEGCGSCAVLALAGPFAWAGYLVAATAADFAGDLGESGLSWVAAGRVLLTLAALELLRALCMLCTVLQPLGAGRGSTCYAAVASVSGEDAAAAVCAELLPSAAAALGVLAACRAVSAAGGAPAAWLLVAGAAGELLCLVAVGELHTLPAVLSALVTVQTWFAVGSVLPVAAGRSRRDPTSGASAATRSRQPRLVAACAAAVCAGLATAAAGCGRGLATSAALAALLAAQPAQRGAPG